MTTVESPEIGNLHALAEQDDRYGFVLVPTLSAVDDLALGAAPRDCFPGVSPPCLCGATTTVWLHRR